MTPRPDALTVRIAAEFLPDIIRDIAPAWRAEEGKDREIISMSGIPGLRAFHRRGRTVLATSGVPGRIIIPVPAVAGQRHAGDGGAIDEPQHVVGVGVEVGGRDRLVCRRLAAWSLDHDASGLAVG